MVLQGYYSGVDGKLKRTNDPAGDRSKLAGYRLSSRRFLHRGFFEEGWNSFSRGKIWLYIPR